MKRSPEQELETFSGLPFKTGKCSCNCYYFELSHDPEKGHKKKKNAIIETDMNESSSLRIIILQWPSFKDTILPPFPHPAPHPSRDTHKYLPKRCIKLCTILSMCVATKQTLKADQRRKYSFHSDISNITVASAVGHSN